MEGQRLPTVQRVSVQSAIALLEAEDASFGRLRRIEYFLSDSAALLRARVRQSGHAQGRQDPQTFSRLAQQGGR